MVEIIFFYVIAGNVQLEHKKVHYFENFILSCDEKLIVLTEE